MPAVVGFEPARTIVRCLTPEEDAIGEPDDDDEIDDTLPSDLWFMTASRRPCGAAVSFTVYSPVR